MENKKEIPNRQQKLNNRSRHRPKLKSSIFC
jgi:hypothetical protein